MKDWQQRLMGKAMTVTDTKTLWGKNPDKRNPCSSTSTCSSTYFCLDNKNNTWGGGALLYKPIWDMPFFRYHFSA